MKWQSCIVVLAVVVFCLGLAFALTELTETPPTWLDEGIFVETARQVAQTGRPGVQIAPDEIVSAGFVTVGFPLLYPIAGVFNLFGFGILEARLVMVVFILLALVGAYLLVAKSFGKSWGFLAMLFLASFAPLYGHGKNVMGEVPGLAFLLFALLGLVLIERGWKSDVVFLLTGLAFALSMATKPIYLLLLFPALFVGFFFAARQKMFTITGWWFFGISLVSGLLVWYTSQFESDGLRQIVLLYSGNPESVPLMELLATNLKRFLTEVQPVYFLGLVALWCVGVVVRLKNKSQIYVAEYVALSFSLLSLCLYLPTVGYYRYFFPGQVIAMIYFLFNLHCLAEVIGRGSFFSGKIRMPRLKIVAVALLCVLILAMHGYALFFNSWVAGHSSDKQSLILDSYLKPLAESNHSVFFYQAPEAAMFFPSKNYYQFFVVNAGLSIGHSSLSYISDGIPDYIFTKGEWREDELYNKYVFIEKVGRYEVLKKQ
jgi:4-amino-4-deoxy-L-arabinose transferase-like glycosyltransferase